jgi:hypothetical protein
MTFVDHFQHEIPPPVRNYVRELSARNQERNQRLFNQLSDALRALNGVGVTPVLLKSTATLATAESTADVARLISDLDIMVASEEAHIALEALSAIGYRVFFQAPNGASKWYVDLERDGDVGMIDLHQQLPGHDYFYRLLGNIRQHCSLTLSRIGTAYVPLPIYQALTTNFRTLIIGRGTLTFAILSICANWRVQLRGSTGICSLRCQRASFIGTHLKRNSSHCIPYSTWMFRGSCEPD